jgi:hypothetical protein
MKSKSAKEKDPEWKIKAIDMKIKELNRVQCLILNAKRVESALKKCNEDMLQAEKILKDKWGKDKAKSMLEGYHRYMDKDSDNPDSLQYIVKLFKGLKGFTNQIKKKSK